MRDIIDQKLRETVGDRPKIESVRPERQQRPLPIVQTDPASIVPPKATKTEAPENTVPNNAPLPTPVSTVDGISLDLPSKFAYYDFKDLYIKPFTVKHLSKLARSQQEASLQMLVEVVSTVLSTPNGDTDIGFKLSTADFTAVLYWLRMNSFAKPQMRYRWICQHDEHIDQVKLGALSPKSLENILVYKESDIKVIHLDHKPDEEKYTLYFDNRPPVRLVPENMLNTIQFLDDPEQRWDSADFQFSAKLAAHLDLPLTLNEKILFVENELAMDHVPLIKEFSALIDGYGIKETVTSKCKECGVSQQVPLTVDTSCFLSPEF